MIKSKKQSFILIWVFTLVLMLGTVTINVTGDTTYPNGVDGTPTNPYVVKYN